MMWLPLLISSLAVPFTLALDCPSLLFDWGDYCCEDEDLGCFDKEPPFDDFPLPCCYDDTEVTFSLYTRDNRDDPVMIRKDGPIPSEWSPDKRTVFESHGWLFPMYDEYALMKDNFLDKEDINVIIIDWPSIRVNYLKSRSETRPVGKMVSLIMNKLVEEGGADYDDLWCVGHSLGAHICGFAGRGTGGKIGRITGLDPAGPGFERSLIGGVVQENVTVGLNAADGQYVDVIHTDTEGQGTVRPLGDIDFYVNGRGQQPGCWLTRRKRDFDFWDTVRRATGCSHARAPDYFTESILSNCFISRLKCTDVDDLPGSCSPCDGATDGVCATMGYNVTGDNGIYYLETNRNFPPHCKG